MLMKYQRQSRVLEKRENEKEKRDRANWGAEHRDYWSQRLDSTMEYISRHHNEQDKAEKKRYAVDYVSAVASCIAIVLSLGSLFAFVILSYQSDGTANRAIRVSEGQLAEAKIEQRPWVYADLALTGKITRDADGHLRAVALYEIHNTGHLPAMNVRSHETVVSFDMTAHWDVARRGQKIVCEPRGNTYTTDGLVGVTVFPGQVVRLPVNIVFPVSQEADSDKGVVDLFPNLVGCLEYQFPNSSDFHQTGFGFMIREKGKGGLDPVPFCSPVSDDLTRAAIAQLIEKNRIGVASQGSPLIDKEQLEITNIPNKSLFYAD